MTEDISLIINPSFLLEHDEARAYSIAALAAAQNDVAVVKAFLGAGLDAASAKHSSQTRGGRGFHHCVWLAAVQNDATETMAAIIEGLATKDRTRLMSAKPQGATSWATALRFRAQKSIDFFLANNLGIRPNEVLSRPLEGSLLFNAALLGQERAVEKMEAKGTAAGYLGSYRVELAHVLAAGDCAQALRRLHARENDALSEPLDCFPLLGAARGREEELEEDWATSGRRVHGIFHSNQINVKNQDGRSVPPPAFATDDRNGVVFDPLDWALLGHAPKAVAVFKEVLGAEKVSARAELWAEHGKKHKEEMIELRTLEYWQKRHPIGGRLQEEFVAFCEAVAIGSSLSAASPSAAEATAASAPARRAVRL